MDIEEIIAQKERLIALKKNNINLAKHIPCLRDSIEETQKEIEKLEESIKQDRKVQLAESKVSGRKSWKDDIWKYIAVGLLFILVENIIRFLLKT